ncbi:MAG: hypothetical protein C0501_12585 [Isosphaera sp.]|nr:hypothetical protein [Isosphaera sp.]
MVRNLLVLGSLGVALVAFTLVGCNKTQPTSAPPPGGEPKPGDPKKDGHGDHKPGDGKKDDHGDHKAGDGKKDDHGHAHKPGAHGGTIVSLGKDSYHAEAVFEKDGAIRLYMLGKDESKPQEIEVQELVAHVTPAGSTDAVQVKLTADPPKGTTAGKTTVFVGKLPHELHGKKVQVTINNIQIGTERFRITFANEKAH